MNNSGNIYSCEKCGEKFESKDFLEIRKGATHKTKCDICDFETGHKDMMKEHVENPGIWHKKKN